MSRKVHLNSPVDPYNLNHYLSNLILNLPYKHCMQPINYIPTITNHTVLWWVPNVIVAHQKEGIEALHLASGRTICKVNNFQYNRLWSFCIFLCTG